MEMPRIKKHGQHIFALRPDNESFAQNVNGCDIRHGTIAMKLCGTIGAFLRSSHSSKKCAGSIFDKTKMAFFAPPVMEFAVPRDFAFGKRHPRYCGNGNMASGAYALSIVREAKDFPHRSSGGMLISENRTATNIKAHTAKTTSAAEPLLHFFTDRYADSYRLQLDTFAAAVCGKCAPMPTFQDGTRAQTLAEAAAKSMRENKPVVVN